MGCTNNDSLLEVKYIVFIGLILVFFLVELVVSIWSGSLTLQTDAFHMLSDLIALIIGYSSMKLMKKEKTYLFTYGWLRAEIIGGLVNSVFLLTICFTIVLDIIEKVSELVKDSHNQQLEREINPVLIVAGLGFLVNLLGLILFCSEHGHHHHGHEHKHNHNHSNSNSNSDRNDIENNINANNVNANSTRSSRTTEEDEIDEELKEDTVNYNHYAVMLHIMGDTLGSVVVIISGLLIKYLDFSWKFYVDPLGSLIIVVIIAVSSFKLFKACIAILLHKSPHDRDQYECLVAKMCEIEGVLEIHHFHIWPLNNKITIASLHVKLNDNLVSNPSPQIETIITKIKGILHQSGIHSSTIQPEWGPQCPELVCEQDCEGRKCC